MRRLLPFASRWSRRRTQGIDDEIRTRTELEPEENIARGTPPDEASYAALRMFGNRTQVVARVREMRGIGWIDRLSQDLSYACRVLRRTPAFTAAAVLTLIIGIGANATMLDVLDRLFVRAPVGVRDPDGTVRVWLKGPGQALHPMVAYPFYAELRDGMADMLDMAAYGRYEYSFGVGPEAVKVRAAQVSDSYFSVLGTRPALGALLGPAAQDRESDMRVVLSYAFWQRHYAGDPSVVGRAVRIGPGTLAIGGVAEPGFVGPDVDATDVWLPLAVTADWMNRNWRNERGGGWYQMIGRLRPGIRREQIEARGSLVFQRGTRSRANNEIHATEVTTLPLIGMPGNTEFRALPWIAAVAALVFFIACANTAMLFYTRVLRRAPEIATRLALGASRRRIVWQLLTEALVVSAVAGAGAATATIFGRDALSAMLLPNVGVLEAAPDVRSVLLAGTLAVLAALVCGGIPAIRLVMSSPALWRAAQAPYATAIRRTQVMSMIAVQAALVVPALVGAGLFLASLRAATSVDLGFDPRGVFDVTTQIGLVVGGGDRQEAARFEQMLDRVRQLPDVRAAALSASPPALRMLTVGIRTRDGGSIAPYSHAVSAGYFAAMGIRIAEGRAFGPEDDRPGAAPVVVVSETLARRMWAGQSAIGQCLMVAGCSTVVGIAADGRLPGWGREPFSEFYLPLRRWVDFSEPAHLIVRMAPGTRNVESMLRRVLGQANAGMPYIEVVPIEQMYEPWIRTWRVAAVLFSTFAVIGLLLAAVGLYGIVSYVTALQHREAAIRVALGASPARLVRSLVVRATAAVSTGLVVGIAVAALGARAVASQLHEVSAQDPAVFATSGSVLLVTCLVAAYLPARRLQAVDPGSLLRYE